jgi:hypothetical protein
LYRLLERHSLVPPSQLTQPTDGSVRSS